MEKCCETKLMVSSPYSRSAVKYNQIIYIIRRKICSNWFEPPSATSTTYSYAGWTYVKVSKGILPLPIQMPPIQRDNVFWNISVLVDQASAADICLHQAIYILQGSWPSVYRLLCVLNDRIRSLLNRRSMQIYAICLNEKHTMRTSGNFVVVQCI